MPNPDAAKTGPGLNQGQEEGGAPAPRFDDLLVRLRGLVEKLEGGNLSLEDSLKSFEEGMNLCQKAAGILDRAEKKVEMLVAAPGGTTRKETFAENTTRATEADDVPF
jgi:exodeoxyribonuclease VII small subunit